MTARKAATAPAETYLAAQLPEVLRSKLVAGIITRWLDEGAAHASGEDRGDLADVFTTTAQEIRDWHDQKPSPDHMNGGAVPTRHPDPA
jgi:hypothetical protein